MPSAKLQPICLGLNVLMAIENRQKTSVTFKSALSAEGIALLSV